MKMVKIVIKLVEKGDTEPSVAGITKAVWMSVKSAPTIRLFNGNTCLQTDFPDNDTAVS